MKNHSGLYRPKYKDPETGKVKESTVWWMSYSCRGCALHPHGGRHRESTDTEKITDAQRNLDARKGKASEGFFTDFNSIMIADLLGAVADDYIAKGNRSLPEVRDQLKNDILPFFAGKRAIDLCADDSLIRSFISNMKQDGKANATINRRLATIRRAFSLAKNRFPMRPIIEMLPERNARKVFFTEVEYLSLIKVLPNDVARPVMVAWFTGWRTPSEILTRERHHVDWKIGRMVLEAGETKNGEGRFFPLTEELTAILREQEEATLKLERGSGRIISCLFHHLGEPMVLRNNRGTVKTTKYFRKAWAAGCKAAGLSGRISHDFRRSAARRFRTEGYDLKIAMRLLGHKTASIYDRYDIITDEEITAEVQKHETDQKSWSRFGQSGRNRKK